MTAPILPAPCPACQAANAPGVKFCAQCGSALAMPAATMPAPASSPAAARPVAAPAALIDPATHVRDVLTSAGATITGDNGAGTLAFQLPYTDRLLGPWTLQFSGSVTPQAAGYAVTARMLPQALAMQFGALAVGAVLLGFVPRSMVSNDMYIGSVVIGLGVTAWMAFSAAPARVKRHVERLLIGAATPAASHQAPSTPAAGATAAGDVFAQLDRLAQMQATGLLSADEVASKKAELLARI